MANRSNSMSFSRETLKTSLAMHHKIKLPQITTMTVIGITVAVVGNVLISLALNLQKLAHKRLEAEKRARARHRRSKVRQNEATSEATGRQGGISEGNEDQERTRADGQVDVPGGSPLILGIATLETQPLLLSQNGSKTSRTYGGGSVGSDTKLKTNCTSTSRFVPSRLGFPQSIVGGDSGEATHDLVPVDIILEESMLNGTSTSRKGEDKHPTAEEDGSESNYLKSKLWWFGFLLMNVGELGNFISYAFAPASLVAPLGTFALLANCLFAPLMLSERFRKIDLLGIFIAIVGAVTVVLSSNTSDSRLDLDALIRAISQRLFIIYSFVYVVGAVVLATLSEGQIGRSWVIVDVGLCALFGGFTVLSTKAVSTLLTLEWIEMFMKWPTYLILIVLVFTGVSQVRYLNRALMRFDSKVVIPVQFVLFNLSAIVGSAILYGDFKKATFHQLVTFLYGCVTTFAGVFIIAWAPANIDKDDIIGSEVGLGQGTNSGYLPEAEDRLPLGSFGRRRTQFSLPKSVGEIPIVRHKASSISVIGISPAQHLLMVHSPPREMPERHREWDSERDTPRMPDPIGRRRAISWIGEDVRAGGLRDGNISNSWSRKRADRFEQER